MIFTADVEDEHHESDVDEVAAMSADVTAAQSTAPTAAPRTPRTPAFHDSDTSSEVITIISHSLCIFSITAVVNV